ncbi:hypothetical protein JTE90_016794 [Oedothorax gibbosus]|uniref:A-kinase anchor protein 7-like phosphoesterase domain-containing protein n=1 Tax=Oedothorax gibbosus TaxID=931172 RepID=A0AAV6VXD5_9ARAC|nr:hypothetical protein JTE90_016794 [Oedothorax gibbosus]
MEEHLQSKRPNYFVAVQITNTKIHENIKEIQDYILSQDSTFDECMIPIPTLHITLMVININNLKTYERAKKALANIHKEHNEIMCKNPLVLEFSGIGHFNNKVVFGKIKENECLTRFCQLAISVEKHFAEVGIPTTDQREFNPHLTIAKMKFPKKNKKRPNKFSELLYEKCINSYLGVETIRSIQLLRMDGPKDSSGYYTGYELMFMPSSPPTFARVHEIAEKKRKIREEIADTVKACTSSSKENY